MDLDVAQVRAFVRTAEELHFGRAAAALGISQQALSKRVARLESLLGTRLLERGATGVRLTEAGARFLPPARQTLAAADAAVAAVVGPDRPLHVDVWGHLYAPMRTLAQVAGRAGELVLGHGRDLPSVTTALLHGDIDAAFGRVHPPLPAALTHRLVRLEPVDAVLSADHRLATEPALRPEQLRDSLLWAPGPLERLDFLHQFAERFGIRHRSASVNLGLPISSPRSPKTRTASRCCPPTCPCRRSRAFAPSRWSTPPRCTPGRCSGPPAAAPRPGRPRRGLHRAGGTAPLAGVRPEERLAPRATGAVTGPHPSPRNASACCRLCSAIPRMKSRSGKSPSSSRSGPATRDRRIANR